MIEVIILAIEIILTIAICEGLIKYTEHKERKSSQKS